MFSTFFKSFVFLSIFIIFICLLFTPIICSNSISSVNNQNILQESCSSAYGFLWPIPGYENISSHFGKRTSPTSRASTYHSGIDIPAPEGTNLYAIEDSVIIFASWGAGGGYTITYQLTHHSDIKVSYCHVSPIMYVSKGDHVVKGQLIGTVGPKNIYGIVNNPYRDSSGNPTNGASTGCHLHFTIKLNNQAVNPLNYYEI